MKQNVSRTGGKRMYQMLASGVVMAKDGQCIDLYNQKVADDVFVTITTRVDQCNHYWVTKVYETE